MIYVIVFGYAWVLCSCSFAIGWVIGVIAHGPLPPLKWSWDDPPKEQILQLVKRK